MRILLHRRSELETLGEKLDQLDREDAAHESRKSRLRTAHVDNEDIIRRQLMSEFHSKWMEFREYSTKYD